ncbi:MAG: 3-hydroxyacyl-CoA dehydrogenase family protein [Anaerolineales bacterium]|nr:3-hydroxyacyl-CoA dehydrogenase family protein [Anaerolineales bacterium]
MPILLVGTEPFVSSLARLCAAGSHHVRALTTADFLANPSPAQEHEVIIEAETTSTSLKKDLLQRLRIGRPEGILLTCALNASATIAAGWTHAPERVVGFGVLPPVPAQGTVELARGLQTSEAAFARAVEFWESLGQQTARVADGAGLVRARVLCAMINEAIGAVQEDVATPADIDLAMKLGMNYPRGPLEWGDEIGLDTVLAVMMALQEEWGEDRYRPAPLLRRMVAAGRLGKKSGAGFYPYPSAGAPHSAPMA